MTKVFRNTEPVLYMSNAFEPQDSYLDSEFMASAEPLAQGLAELDIPLPPDTDAEAEWPWLVPVGLLVALLAAVGSVVWPWGFL